MVFKKRFKKCLCYFLASAMVLSMFTTLNLSVFAEDPVNVNLVNNGDMEDGTNWWYNIGDPTLESVTDEKHGGESSIKASGRTASWQGIAQNLVNSEVAKPVAGNKYHASAWVMFKGDEAPEKVKFTLSMRTTKDNTNPTYENITSVDAVKGEWTLLAADCTIPSDSLVDKDVHLYVETGETETFVDYYLDDVAFELVGKEVISYDFNSELTPLRSVWDEYFPLGIAARPDMIDSEEYSPYIRHHYSGLVAENCMKPEAIQPVEGKFTFEEADKLVDFAAENNMAMRGHTLLWHSQIPDWFFTDPEDSTKPATSEKLLERLKTHIETIMTRYKGKIDTYDVVNEVISDSEGLRDSKWRNIVGDLNGDGIADDYILKAFEYAFETSKRIGDDKVKFCINDYSIESNTKKLDTMYTLVEKIIKLAKEEGIAKERIVVGFQMHINMYGPSIAQIKKSLEKFIGMGIKVQVTELDISIYKSSDEAAKVPTKDILQAHAKKYMDLFKLFKEEAQKGLLDSVTIWGGDDGGSWLNDFPVKNRPDAPLLFNKRLQAKPAYIALTDPDSLSVPRQQINAAKATPVLGNDTDKLWDTISFTDVSQAVYTSVYDSTYSMDGVTAAVKLMWDDNNLYVLSQVEDTTPHAKDSFEIFFNADSAATEGNKHFTITTNNTVPDEITCYTKTNAKGYTIQAAIPISDITPKFGDKIGIDFRVNDYNEDGILSSQVVWNDYKNKDMTVIGYVVLDKEIKLLKVKNGTPVVDGNIDDIWNSVDAASTDVWVSGTSGSKAKFKTLWDDKNLYVLAEVTDSLLSKKSANAYEQDSIEIFFDQNNGKTGYYEKDDYQIRVNFDNEVSYNPGMLEGFTSAANKAETGYIVEAAIPFTAIKAEAGKLLGFDLQVNNDENDDGVRDSVSIWCDPSGQSWQNLSGLGNIMLDEAKATKIKLGYGLDSNGRMVSNFGSPIIDGEIDDVWKKAQLTGPKSVSAGVYAEVTFRSLWDDNALYFLAEVKDEYMSVQSGNPYEQDSFEIFLDENNDKTKDYGVDDLHLRVNYENVQTLDNGDAERFFSSAVKIEGGYLIEARVQLKDKPSNGKVLGVELQINDGVGTGRVGTINLFDSTNGAWNDTGLFGEVILTGKEEGAVSGLNPYSLMNLIKKTNKLDFTRYKNASVVTDAIEKAEEVLADKNVTQKQIDEQYNALKTAIGKLILTEEAANEKEFKPLPDEYRFDNAKQGTIERLSYDFPDTGNGTVVKNLNIYLPYGYNPSNTAKKYNVLYLMHGGGENVNTIFGGPGESKELKKILDNMIAKGDIEPLIVVTPTFYEGKNGGNVELFHEELTGVIIPLVETTYNTYLKSKSTEDMKSSREHRAFGGFSMGSMTTWNVFANCLDYVKYYMPLCAGFRFGSQNPDEPSSAEYLANVARNSGYKVPDDFKIFAASGSADIAHPGMEPQINEMRELSDVFIYSSDTKKGNLYFVVCDGGTHAWGYVNQYIYNILPDLFKDTGKTPGNSGSSSGGTKNKNKTSGATETPTPTPTAAPTVTPSDTTIVEEKETIPAAVYSDISNHWAKDFINDLLSKNIISGYQDGTIKPDQNITRAELTVIVAKAMGLKPAENPVPDFQDKDSIPTWAVGYIALAKEKGIVLGYEDKTFRPDKNCTRQEAVTIIMNAFKLGESSKEVDFNDAKDISGWAYKSVAKATESKIIDGYPDNTFRPGKTISRAEAFTVLSKCLSTK